MTVLDGTLLNAPPIAVSDRLHSTAGAIWTLTGLVRMDGTPCSELSAPRIRFQAMFASSWYVRRPSPSIDEADACIIQILRVAARNYAAFEWIHHEHVGRDAGLTTEQLATVRDTSRSGPSPSKPAPLSALQAAALAFADASTYKVKMPSSIVEALKQELGKQTSSSNIDQQLTEAAATVAAYNSTLLCYANVDCS